MALANLYLECATSSTFTGYRGGSLNACLAISVTYAGQSKEKLVFYRYRQVCLSHRWSRRDSRLQWHELDSNLEP